MKKHRHPISVLEETVELLEKAAKQSFKRNQTEFYRNRKAVKRIISEFNRYMKHRARDSSMERIGEEIEREQGG